MKRAFLIGFALVVAGCGYGWGGNICVGTVTKLSQDRSQKGFKSWEGEMLLELPANATAAQPKTFEFYVDPKALEKVKHALATGERVKLLWKGWLYPPAIDHPYVVVDVRPTK